MYLFINKIKPIMLAVIGAMGCAISSQAAFAEITAPVSGFARSFLSGESIADATITVLETQQKIKTNKDGRFGPFEYPVGKPITLLFEKSGYITTQSGTSIVPKEGLNDHYSNITFQVASTYVFYILKKTVGAKEDPESCHLTSTVTAYHKTLDDIPQGEPDAVVTITPAVNEQPFYFDIFKSGPLKNKTYPFPTGITQTSADGGIAFFNLPPREQPYTLIAVKNGVIFSEAQFTCHKGAFINISPPRGPMAQQVSS